MTDLLVYTHYANRHKSGNFCANLNFCNKKFHGTSPPMKVYLQQTFFSNTVEPLNNEEVGAGASVCYLEVSFIGRFHHSMGVAYHQNR